MRIIREARGNAAPQGARGRLVLGIRAWVLLASLMSALPVLAFALWTLRSMVLEQQARDERVLVQRAQAAAGALAQRFERAAASLEAQAVSQSALRMDLAGLHEEAIRVQAAHPDILSIALTRRDGVRIFSTARAWGSPLPPGAGAGADADAERAVFDGARVVHLPLFRDRLLAAPAMAVAVPLRIDGEVVFSLRMSLASSGLSSLLSEQQLPDDWTVAAIDPSGVIAARTKDAGRFVGTRATDTLLAAIASGGACPYRTLTKTGVDALTCAVEVPGTGWHVAVGVPAAAFSREVSGTLRTMLVGGLACAAGGLLGALAIARVVSRQLRQPARALAGGAASEEALAGSRIREVVAMNDGLARARRREDELVARLSHARHDALTGLPGRGLFRERVERDAAGADAAGDRIAMLFIDLDGFKGVNDRWGHRAGDEALRRVAAVIRGVVREGAELAARLGGDEFAIYLRGPGESLREAAESTATRLIDGIAGLGDGLGCSIGIAMSDADAALLPEVLACADGLMIQAKRAGKGRYALREVGWRARIA